jgi:ribonuclease HI
LSPKPAALKIQIDGAARGNPGPAGAGVVLSDPRGKKLKELAVYLGESTNNVAETCALLLGLQEALRLGSRRVSVLTDSELLARQVTGVYRVKDERLRLLHALIHPLKESFERFEIRHVPREENKAADRLANKAVTQGLRGQLTLFEV